METKNIINIPEGYEIDKDKSNDSQIKNQRSRSWNEYCERMKGKSSYWLHEVDGDIKSKYFCSEPYLSEFEDKEDVEALIAFCKLRKLRKDWIGEWKPDWTSYDIKFTIIIENNHIVGFINRNVSRPMSFPTREMRNEFIECFKDLIEQAKRFI